MASRLSTRSYRRRRTKRKRTNKGDAYMRKLCLIACLLCVSSAAQNLTPAQKDADFRFLASLFSAYYAPADWKNQLFNFDLLRIQPWLDKVANTQTDLDFYEVCVDYVA